MTATPSRIRVWDLPTRIFHWALVVLVVFSFTTGKLGGSWMAWHLKSGYVILSLLVFRLAWGIVGGHTARFVNFVRGPRAFLAHASAIVSRTARAVPGHNPTGGWMVLFLLAILLAQAATGLFSDDEIATTGPLVEKVSNAVVGKMTSFHSYNGWVIAVAAGVHVIAIAYYHLALKVDVVGPMVLGWREGNPSQSARMGSTWLAAALLAVACGAVYWLVVIYPKG